MGARTRILSLIALCLLALGLVAGPAMAQTIPPGFPDLELPAILKEKLAAPGQRFDLHRFRLPPFQNNPERTARAFTRDVFLAAAAQGNRRVILNWFKNGPGFTFNTQQTALAAKYDSDAPAYADILGEPGKNFLQCEGGPFALCFYSGPFEAPVPNIGALPCTTSKYDTVSECTCVVIDAGLYFVDILGILNEDVYEETVKACGPDGSGCKEVGTAPVCDVVNEKLDEQAKMFPGANLISVFSGDFAKDVPIGNSACNSGREKYAGCMTAPCYYPNGDPTSDTAQCLCPNYKGDFQVGQNNIPPEMCSLGDNNVWSAANNVGDGTTFPPDDAVPE